MSIFSSLEITNYPKILYNDKQGIREEENNFNDLKKYAQSK